MEGNEQKIRSIKWEDEVKSKEGGLALGRECGWWWFAEEEETFWRYINFLKNFNLWVVDQIQDAVVKCLVFRSLSSCGNKSSGKVRMSGRFSVNVQCHD